MKPRYLVVMFLAIGLFAISPIGSLAQWEKKAYTEWSEKDAQKILNESPWGQTQVVSDLSNTFSTGPGKLPEASQDRLDSSPDHLNFRIRFLSAKPVRQAITRLQEIGTQKPTADQMAGIKAFLASDFPDRVVIAVNVDSKDNTAGRLQAASSILTTRTTAILKNKTYLQVKGGERVFLQEYEPPGKDGLGAKFVFPRLLNGQPYIIPERGEVQFYSELTGGLTLNMRYKLKAMMFEGKFEY